jgi:hypothetical protein
MHKATPLLSIKSGLYVGLVEYEKKRVSVSFEHVVPVNV